MNQLDQEILKQTKEDFLHLTRQYANLGALLSSMRGVELDEDQTHSMKALLLQFREMGEQLKTVGAGLDVMGGESVMHGPDFKLGRYPSAN